MRLNRFVALCTGLSRRHADKLIGGGRVLVNGQRPGFGHIVANHDEVTLDGSKLRTPDATQTIMLNKPEGYVCSRDGQGSPTIYELLPEKYHSLKSVGRLDKDSSGLILLTNDGRLAQTLTHPSFHKEKVYEVRLNKPLSSVHLQKLRAGVRLEDGISKLGVQQLEDSNQELAEPLVSNASLLITMTEGRNRQIRRTFAEIGYTVTRLHRIGFGDYRLGTLQKGQFVNI